MTTKSRPSRYAAEAKTGDESNMVPLGSRVIGSNDGTPTVSLPKETVEDFGIRSGDEMQVSTILMQESSGIDRQTSSRAGSRMIQSLM